MQIWDFFLSSKSWNEMCHLLLASIYEVNIIFGEIFNLFLFCFNSTFRRKVQREERRQKTQDQIDRMKKKQRESELWRNRRSYLAPIAIGTTLLIGGLLLYYYYFWQIFFLCKKKKMATSFFMCTKSLCLKKYRIWPWTSFFSIWGTYCM